MKKQTLIGSVVAITLALLFVIFWLPAKCDFRIEAPTQTPLMVVGLLITAFLSNVLTGLLAAYKEMESCHHPNPRPG